MPCKELIITNTFLASAIKIVRRADLQFVSARYDGIHQFVAFTDARAVKWPVIPVVLVGAAIVAFESTKKWQNVFPSPALISSLLPGVVILRLPTDIDKAVD